MFIFLNYFVVLIKFEVSHLKELKLRFPTYTQQIVVQIFELIHPLINSLKPTFFKDYLLPTISKSPPKSLFGETTVFHPVSLQINEPISWLDRLFYNIVYREQKKRKS